MRLSVARATKKRLPFMAAHILTCWSQRCSPELPCEPYISPGTFPHSRHIKQYSGLPNCYLPISSFYFHFFLEQGVTSFMASTPSYKTGRNVAKFQILTYQFWNFLNVNQKSEVTTHTTFSCYYVIKVLTH